MLAANYGIKFVEVLRDTSKLPLFVGITTTINETYLYADLIVPDTTYLETGTNGVQFLYASGGGLVRAEGWRSPVIMPLTQKIGTCPNGHPRHASMWELLIDLGKALGMPGYGDKAIPGVKGRKYEGQWFSMHCFWEYVMRVFANAAMHAKDLKLIPEDVPDEEVQFVERNYPIAQSRTSSHPTSGDTSPTASREEASSQATRNPSTPAATLNAEFPATNRRGFGMTSLRRLGTR